MDASRPAYSVVVAVSDPVTAVVALHWALEQAAARKGRVVALRAWRVTPPQTSARVTPAPLVEDEHEGEVAARQRLNDDVAAVLGPDHSVETRLVVGPTRKALVQASAEADLLVVAAPRTPELSMSPLRLRRLVAAAQCPVVVIPPAVSHQPAGALRHAGQEALRQLVGATGHAGRPGVRPPSTYPG